MAEEQWQTLFRDQTPDREMSPQSNDSERSAGGTMRNLQDKQVDDPQEKKTLVVVPSPISPRELRKICLSSDTLEKWCHMPFFAATVTGCFVRVATGDSVCDKEHCIVEILSVSDTGAVYQLGSTRTDMALKVRHADQEQAVSLRSASNQKFTLDEFKRWELAMTAARCQLPTLGKIAAKEKSIKEALDHIYSQEDIDAIVAKRNTFRDTPLNIAKRKIQLFGQQMDAAKQINRAKLYEIQKELQWLDQRSEDQYKQRLRKDKPKGTFVPAVLPNQRPAPKAPSEVDLGSMDPFVRTKTKPILITNLKNDSVREAVRTELDQRYGFGYTPVYTSMFEE